MLLIGYTKTKKVISPVKLQEFTHHGKRKSEADEEAVNNYL